MFPAQEFVRQESPGLPTGIGRRLLAVLALAVMAACAAPQSAPDRGSPTSSHGSSHDSSPVASGVSSPGGQAAQPSAGPAASDGTPQQSAPRQAALLPGPDYRTPASRASPPVDPADIVGLTRERIRNLLGQPAFVRRESLAEFWRYRHESCVLELYFYRGTGEPVLDHLETRHRTGDGHAAADCLGALVAANRRH